MSTSVPTQGWWRRQRAWLLGAAVLGAWALYMPYREWREMDQHLFPTRPIVVEQGVWARYEGARWRLLGTDIEPLKRQRRDDAVALVARFEVIPDPGTTAATLDACKARVSDRQERHWDPDSGSQLGTYSALPTSCGSGLGARFEQVEAKPGQAWSFVKVFKVPRTLDARELQPEIIIRWPKQSPNGSFLRFRPQP